MSSKLGWDRRLRTVTLTLVCEATDGALVMADGLRTKTLDESGPREVVADDDVKLLAVPHASAVVLSSGRATYNNVHVSVILEQALALAAGPFVLNATGATCAAALTSAHTMFPSVHDARLLVVGYEDAARLEAIHVDVPARDFGDGLKSIRAVEINPLMPVLANPADSESGGLVLMEFDAYSDFLDEVVSQPPPAVDAYRFAGLPLGELRPAAVQRVTDWLNVNSAIAAADGIGGLWSIAEVRPGEGVTIETGIRLT